MYRTYTVTELGFSSKSLERVKDGRVSISAYLKMIAIAISKEKGYVTIDDIRRLAEVEGIRATRSDWSIIFRDEDKWESIGMQPSNITSNKKRQVNIWKLK